MLWLFYLLLVTGAQKVVFYIKKLTSDHKKVDSSLCLLSKMKKHKFCVSVLVCLIATVE